MQENFVKRVLTISGVIAAIILGVLLIINGIDALLLVFAAILLAVFFRGLSELLHRRSGLSEGFSLAIVVFGIIGSLVLLGYLLAPSIAEQVRELRNELPQSIESLRVRLDQTSWGHAILEQIPPSDQLLKSVQGASILSRATGFFSTTLGVLVNVGVVLLLGVYFAAEPKTYTEGFLRLVPLSRRIRAREIVAAVAETLRWWLVGKFGSMLAIGVLTWIGLWLLGVPLALTLGIITALLTFIPNLGPILSVIPAALLALAQDPIRAVYVIALYVGVQLVESNLITPLIERRTIELPPALTISLQLLLSVFVGGLGLVLATPLVAVGLVLVQMLYIEDVLGDKMKTPDEKEIDDKNDQKEGSNKVPSSIEPTPEIKVAR